MGLKVVYDNVESYQLVYELIELKLTNGKRVVVPGMWTVIEEK